MRALSPAVLLATIVGCSQPSGSARHDPQQPIGSNAGSSATGATVPSGSATPAGPTAAECTALFAHAVEIRVAEQRKTVPPEQLPTPAEQADLRASLEANVGPACRAGSRASYQCGMAATTLAEFEACR